MDETFGERLRRLREAQGLSLSKLAFNVGVTEGAIRQIESGQTKNASLIVGLKLARVLGVSPWLLATGEATDSSGEYFNSDMTVSEMIEAAIDDIESLAGRADALEGDVAALRPVIARVDHLHAAHAELLSTAKDLQAAMKQMNARLAQVEKGAN